MFNIVQRYAWVVNRDNLINSCPIIAHILDGLWVSTRCPSSGVGYLFCIDKDSIFLVLPVEP